MDLPKKRYASWRIRREIIVDGRIAYSCECRHCGAMHKLFREQLAARVPTSCGCKQRTHGMSDTPEYRAFQKMWNRCTREAEDSYPHYGGRGIRVDAKWSTFEAFFADMGPRPSPAHSLERIDNNGNYTKDNCVWATRSEQVNNRRNTIRLTLDGVTKPLATWAAERGLEQELIRMRLYAGWSVERALGPRIKPWKPRRKRRKQIAA